jgi:hypothetical protein
MLYNKHFVKEFLMSTIAKVFAGIFITMVSLRTLLSIAAPALHKRISSRFYRTGGKAAYLYQLLFLAAAALLIYETSIIGFILAFMCIGFLYDYFFSLFPQAAAELVRQGEGRRKKLWFFAYLVPWTAAIWFYLTVFEIV